MWFRSLHLTGAVRVMAIPRSTGAQQAQANLQTAAIGQPRLAPHACGLGWVWEPATQPMVNGSLRIAPHVTRNRTGEIRILRNETLSPQNRSGARDRTGGRAPEYLRLDRRLIEIVRSLAARDKPIAAICHAVQILAAADVIRGRRVSGYAACAPGVRLAGGDYVETSPEGAIRDGNLVTGFAWSAHPQFLALFLEVLGARVSFSSRCIEDDGSNFLARQSAIARLAAAPVRPVASRVAAGIVHRASRCDQPCRNPGDSARSDQVDRVDCRAAA